MRRSAILASLSLALIAIAGCGDEPADAFSGDPVSDVSSADAVDATDAADATDDDADAGDVGPDGADGGADGGADTEADATADADASPEVGEGLFAAGCPRAGAATARLMTDADALTGPNALGGAGDFVLFNTEAVYVIQGVYEPRRTYWYYGGQAIDAVALDGCAQAGPERFDEQGFIVGTPRIDAFDQSTLRGFRAERVEVISDGSDGGPAHVRATGTDDFFWLIELELIAGAFTSGSPKPMSEPMGLEIVVDYVLQPDSAVLEMSVQLRNETDASSTVITGMVNFFADTTRGLFYNESRLSFGGFNLAVGLPWLVSEARDYSLAVNVDGAQTGTINISGVDALVNIDQFFTGATLRPAGRDGDTRTDVYHLSVGAGGVNAAITPLIDAVEQPIPGVGWTLQPMRVQVVDAVSGDGLAGVELVLERQNGDGDWSPIDGFYTDADGRFEGAVAVLDGARDHRLRALDLGRPSPDPVAWAPGADEPTRIELGRGGQVRVTVTEPDAASPPAKVLLFDDGRIVRREYAVGVPLDLAVEPGVYDLTVSRGLEYSVYRETIEVVADAELAVDATIERVLDTTGYLSMDGHVHGGPSPDSAVTIPMRAVTLAAENVEVAVSTDHEAILPWAPGFAEAGMTGWVATVLGEEVTPPLPEHSNAYPFPDRSDEAARGVQVPWFGEDIAGVYAASRERGAQVVALNHPRNGCNYMCLIGYDRVLGDATLDDPTLLSFEPDAELWSWDFDTVEYMNGHDPVFVDPARPDSTGTFDDWMSFLNHGHRITATGVTDVHGLDARGTPRNFFVAPTDDPAAFTDDMLVTAMLEGRSMVSTGAFARVSIADAGLGDTVTVEDGAVALDVRVEALPEIDVTAIQVFANCDEVAWVEATDPDGVVKFDDTIEFTIEQDAHVVVLAHGEGRLPEPMPQFDPVGVPRVTTNPIYVDVDGDGDWTAPGGRTCTYTRPTRDKADDGHDHDGHDHGDHGHGHDDDREAIPTLYDTTLSPGPCVCGG